MESSREDIEAKKTHSSYSQSEENNRNRETHVANVTECASKKDTHEKCVVDSDNQQHDAHQVVESDALDCKIVSGEMCSSKDESFNMESKMFKNHKEKKCDLQASNASKTDIAQIMLCEPCTSENLQVQATHFCQTCDDPEPLCDTCASHHTKQKLGKNHKLSKKIEDFTKSEKMTVEKLLCEPCSSENQQIPATHFCKTCDDPEPLCETCAKYHTKQKPCKSHEICGDIKELQKSEKSIVKEILCEPCSTERLQIPASFFCKTCKDPEPLCETCAKHHTKQKLSKNHELCGDIKDFRKSHTETLCEPCTTEKLQVKATHFCKTCDDPEPLCDACAKYHTKQRCNKYHKMCNDMGEFRLRDPELCKNKETETVCEPCFTEKKKITATHFCKTCIDPEPLCEACAKGHIRQKICKDHKICDQMEEFHQHKTYSGENTETKTFCEPCFNEKKKITATHFCKTCEDPELLCEACAKGHIRQKICKDHKICGQIDEFHKNKTNSGENTETKTFCEPCFNENKKITATYFCETCDDPEPLCGACAKEHTRQKISKDHKLCGQIEKFPQIKRDRCKNKETKTVCGPCFNENKQVTATHFCKTCNDPEPLCEACAKEHIRQKISTDHKLSNKIERFPETKSNDCSKKTEFVCEPCSNENKLIPATTFCKTCNDPELLCETCAKQHVRQKTSKDHKLCSEIRKFSKSKICSGYTKAPMKPVKDDKTPGKPSSTEINSNSLTLVWEKSIENVTYYQVRYKCSDNEEKWKFSETDSSQNCLVITGLMSKTDYTFQVRGVFKDVDGPYSPVSDNITTNESGATHILEKCKVLKKGHPSKYLLPAKENTKSRNEHARTRQLVFGKPPQVLDEKTILLVGATGSGKSTLVDGFVNYIMGVSFDDPFRFTTAMLEDEEKKTHNQAVSQTEWITVYKLHPITGSRLKYTLNIIDTPGFGDTRGIERDNAIVDQIRHLFCSEGDDGVLYIDAVCLIVKAPDARLTVVQKYIFSSMLALFGKDIESNMCTLITFADGAEPPVLASLRELKLPHETTLTFNNSALFAVNNDLANNTLSPMFWEMGCRSFERFFKHIKDLKATSLSQTKDVLEEREQLSFVISNIRPQITAGLSKLSELQQKLDIFQRCKSEIENNQNFEYTVEETKQRMLELLPGHHVTNCLHCNITCHEECRIPDNEEKKRCWAMDKEGNCRICPEKCIWSAHKNTPFIFKYVTEKVTKTYAEMKERYEDAIGQTITHEKYIEDLTYCVDDMFGEINSMMNEMNRCKTRLKEIALRPDPLSAVEYIDLMIQSEQEEKQPGHLNRVKMLKEFRKMALVGQDVEDLSKNIQEARENTKTIIGKSFERDTEAKKKTRNIVLRGYQYIKNLF